MNLTKEQLEIVKKEHPEWYELPNGKWYKHTISKAICFKVSDNKSYGFGCPEFGHNYYGLEHGTTNFDHINDWIVVAGRQVEELLIKEAEKRGLSKGSTVVFGSSICGEYTLDSNGDYIFIYGCLFWINPDILVHLFRDGEWAKLTPSQLDKDIQALKDKYPQFKITVTFE